MTAEFVNKETLPDLTPSRVPSNFSMLPAQDAQVIPPKPTLACMVLRLEQNARNKSQKFESDVFFL